MLLEDGTVVFYGMSNDLKCVTPRGERAGNVLSCSGCWLQVCSGCENSAHCIPMLCALFCNHFYSIITFTVLLMDLMWDSRGIKQVSPLGFWNEQLGGEWCQLFLYREGLVENRSREERRGQIRNLVGAMLSLTCAVKSPQNHLQVQWFARRIHETQKNCCTHNYSLLQQKDTV